MRFWTATSPITRGCAHNTCATTLFQLFFYIPFWGGKNPQQPQNKTLPLHLCATGYRSHWERTKFWNYLSWSFFYLTQKPGIWTGVRRLLVWNNLQSREHNISNIEGEPRGNGGIGGIWNALQNLIWQEWHTLKWWSFHVIDVPQHISLFTSSDKAHGLPHKDRCKPQKVK